MSRAVVGILVTITESSPSNGDIVGRSYKCFRVENPELLDYLTNTPAHLHTSVTGSLILSEDSD